MPLTGEQVNVTGNQSTLKVSLAKIFLFDNRYDKKTLTNTAAAATITLKAGHLVHKSGATIVDLLDAAANIDNIVGIVALENDTDILNAASLDINIATEGTIAEEGIVLTGGVTLDTVIPTTNRTLRDHLFSIGFHLEASVENTKFDNI